MNHLLYLALKKSGLNRLVYNASKNERHEYIDICAETVGKAEALLHSIAADPKQSCICENKVDGPKYDLQIIVPAYNVEKYIAECLDSVLSQVTSFRYIVKVINDGSTDGTSRILETYRNKPGIEITTQKNKGFSGARNTGLATIEARYVMFLDSDDKLAPGAIHALLSMAQNTSADIVEGSSVKFYGPFITAKYLHPDCTEANADKLFSFAWGKVYKASLFYNIKFPEGYWFEDTLCALILHPAAKKVSTISHRVYCYRTNFKGISRTFRGNPKCMDSFYICERLLSDMTSLGMSLDNGWADKMARQFRLNSNRISSLKRDDIDKAVFTLQSHLMRQYFSDFETDNLLVRSLLEGNYKAFRLQTKWL